MNNTYVNILDSEEEKISNKVEQIFQTLESEGQNPKYQKYTEAYREQELQRIADSKVQELRNIRNKYIEECEKAIENYKMNVSAPQIVDSYSLMTNKYKLISQPLEKQIEVLGNMTNQNDFEIMKGMILERLTDQEQIRQVMKIQIPTTETVRKQALGQLRYRTANIDYIPGMNISRKASIGVGGLEYYCNTLLGIGDPLFDYF
jgi:vacuolar-type H+-ATPase subunit E/Vma4